MIAFARFLRRLLNLVLLMTLGPSLLAFGILAVIYIQADRELPPLNSEFDIDGHLRSTIEGERRNLRPEAGIVHPEVAWKHPTLADYPNDFVLMQMAEYGCPTFFQTARESKIAWMGRVFKGWLFGRDSSGRDGRCELHFARELASNLRVADGAQEFLAAYRIREILGRDQLVAYEMASLPLEPGYFGVHDAARLFLHRPLAQLSLAELAELAIALPPYNLYDAIRQCDSVLMIRKRRDNLLITLGEAGVLPLERARAAEGEAVSCEHH